MRGKPDYQSQIYYAIDIESWIPTDHPLRRVKARADEVLSSMRRDFDKAYARMGRPSIPPEMLLKALLLQALYSIRSERQLVESPISKGLNPSMWSTPGQCRRAGSDRPVSQFLTVSRSTPTSFATSV